LVEYGQTKHPISVAGTNRELSVLRRVLRIAKEWRVIQSVPVIHTLPGEKVSERILDHEEEYCYLAAASPLLRQFAAIAIDTGFRPEEVLKMRWENVKFDPAGNARYGHIHNPSGKSFRAKRSIPMTARVRELLKAQHESSGRLRWGWVFSGQDAESHVSYSSIRSQHVRLIKKLKLKPFRLYDMRHTFLTRLGESGADAFTIQKMAGHSSIVVSTRYVHPTPERVEDAMSRLEKYNQRQSEVTIATG
jgi:integrase